MHPKYPRVFSPIKLGPVEVSNRFYFSPHGTALTVGPKPSADLVAYCVERVRDGGCGLVILSCTLHERGRHYQPCPHPPETVGAFRALADAVHQAGGRIFAQAWYHWLGAGNWQPLSPPAAPFGPSKSQFGVLGRTGSTHEMTRGEIRMMHEALRQSVRNLRAAGFDGIEIHASHSGLIEQFISPYFNRRTDEHGGSLENRLRFLVESLTTAREAAGPAMAVGMRFNCDELLQGGFDTAGAAEALEVISGKGLLDFLDLDVAMEPKQIHIGMPTAFLEKQFYRPYVEKLRHAAGDVPVLSVLGRITDMAEAENALASGVCDMAGAARQLIAEPQFVKHAREGNEHLSRVCIACNWCLGAMGDGAQGCTINPASYRERRWGGGSFGRAAKPGAVAVIGGGPAGMEAARVAALKGHQVTLFEAREQLGGALALWAKLPGREFVLHAAAWWERELTRLGVTIRCSTKASADAVLALGPAAVIVATGSAFARGGESHFRDQPIPGSDQAHVLTPEAVLLGDARPRGRIVLLDGEGTHASSGIAELLAGQGCEVIQVSPEFTPFSARIGEAFEAHPVARRLDEAGVRFLPGSWAREIGARDLRMMNVFSGREFMLQDIDGVVLLGGRVPVDDIARALEGKAPQLYVVGDALGVRSLAAATFEAQKFARCVGEEGAPATVGEAWFRAEDPDVYPVPAG